MKTLSPLELAAIFVAALSLCVLLTGGCSEGASDPPSDGGADAGGSADVGRRAEAPAATAEVGELLPDGGLPERLPTPSETPFVGECDPMTGLRYPSGGDPCPSNEKYFGKCEWVCVQRVDPLPLEWDGAGTSACRTQENMVCEGRACGSVTVVQDGVPRTATYNCGLGSACFRLPEPRTWQLGSSTETAQGVCRKYCRWESDCGAAGRRCVQADLPCPLRGGTFGQAPAPIPGVGLCEEPARPVAVCRKAP